jgi:hypothetical protein
MRALAAALPHRSPKTLKNFYNNHKRTLDLEQLRRRAGHQLPSSRQNAWG